MLKKITHPLKRINKYGLAAFLIPFLLMMACYGTISIFFGTDRSVLASDAFSQFSNFHASFNNVLHGKQNLFYSWNATLGLNYYALISYYLGGIFTPLVFLFDNRLIPDALYFLTLLKIGFAGLAFWYYARETFKINPWSHVSLAVSYSLMSFITAHSELIMWLDTFIYLPLIFLGINRVLADRRPLLLFISYFLLFISNFYFGFMVGLISFFYVWARSVTNWSLYQKNIIHYLLTSLLAGGASMVMILPTVLDLRSNGETLTKITTLKTAATGVWDLVMKNMIGIYDTTKYGSIPFVYVGLLPLLFCLYYFASKKIPLKNKLAYGSLFLLVGASFYFVPFNLFWHGMHAPNMFLFRYSFTFSFLVIMIAGYGLEHFKREDSLLFVSITLILIGLFMTGFAIKGDNYDYVSQTNFLVTIIFLLLYLIGIVFNQLTHSPNFRVSMPLKSSQIAVLLLVLVSLEAVVNTHGMLNGILNDWRYASRSLYTEPYKDYADAVEAAKKEQGGEFFRMETLDPVSSNDSLNYGFSGISLFSSIRNRNTTKLLNDLGFRSRGTGLNTRYPNNTLLMDSLFGIKYNHTKDDPAKFGFALSYTNDSYQMYQNQYSLPLGMMTNEDIYPVNFPTDNNLGAQTNLINQLAQTDRDFFSFITPTTTGTTNVTTRREGKNVTYEEIEGEIAKDVTYEVIVPPQSQAYLSLFPTNFGDLDGSTATVTVGGRSRKSQIDITGQYYNLGYYEYGETVSVTVSFHGTKSIRLIDPPVVILNVPAYEEALTKIAQQGVKLTVKGRKAQATVTATAERDVLFTTIPYDQGWRAYVDGQETALKPFKDGLLTVPLTPGEHHVELVFLPQGFVLGMFLLVGCTSLFVVYLRLLSRQRARQQQLLEPERKKRKRKSSLN